MDKTSNTTTLQDVDQTQSQDQGLNDPSTPTSPRSNSNQKPRKFSLNPFSSQRRKSSSKPIKFKPDSETQSITPLVPRSMSDGSTDMFLELMQATKGMTPDEVKAYLERRKPEDDAKGREEGRAKNGELEYWGGW